MKPKYAIRHFDGDDCYSWAVFRKADIPKGYRGPIFSGMAEPLVEGCSRAQAESEKKRLEALKEGSDER